MVVYSDNGRSNNVSMEGRIKMIKRNKVFLVSREG